MSAYQLAVLGAFTILVLGLARRFPGFALSRPVSLLVTLVGLGFGGLLAFVFLPVELMPNTSSGVITITTPIRGGMSPLDVESLVSKPIEEAVFSVAHVRDVYSNSKQGKSVVSLEFEPGTNMDFATLDVREKFSKVAGTLPREIEHPIIAHYRESDVPVFIFALTSSKRSPEEMRLSVDESLKEKLLRVKGVANVDVVGGRERKIIIDVDRQQLAAHNLDIRQVVQSIEESNINVQTGSLRSDAMTTSIRAVGQFANVKEIENTVIGHSRQGTSLYVRDVAQVRDSFMELETMSRLNAESAVTIYLQKESNGNTVQVVKKVQEILASFKKTLPADTEYVEISNQADAILSAINSVRESLLLGILFVMVVLGFFLGIQSALAVAISIPVATLVTGAIMYLEKLSLNVMTLSGLALGIGLLVDNSIVVLETLHKALEHVKENFREKVLHEATSVTPAIIGGTLTTIVVFIPFLLLSKQIQLLYAGVAITITAALVSSLYVALTTVPAYVLRTKTKPVQSAWAGRTGFAAPYPQAEKFIARLESFYAETLPKIFAQKWRFLAAMAGLFLIAAYVFQFHLDKNFSTGQEKDEFIVFVELPSGKLMEISDSIVKQVEDKIRSHEKTASCIETITTRVEGWSSKIYVTLKPKNKRKYSSEEIIEELRALMKDIGRDQEAFVYFSTPKEGQELIVNIYGQQEKVVADYAMQVAGLLEKDSAFKDTKIRYRPGRPEVSVNVNAERAALFGLSPTDVGNVLHAQTRGLRATYYRDQGNEVETIVRIKVDQRESIDSIKTLLIPTPRGNQIPLAQIADFDYSLAPSEIWRHNKERMIQVSANISKMSLEEAAGKVQKMMKEIPFNTDYWAEIGGDYKERVQAQKDFEQAGYVTSILIFAVMACLFESLIQPLILFISVPLTVIGVVLALLITRTPVTMGVMIGMLMTGGIAVNNAIILVHRFNAKRSNSGEDLPGQLVSAGRDRLRPILMTTMTAVLGLLPMALDRSNGAELWRPMAITAIGGLSVSMFFTLFVVPCLIVVVEETRSRFSKKAVSVDDPSKNPVLTKFHWSRRPAKKYPTLHSAKNGHDHQPVKSVEKLSVAVFLLTLLFAGAAHAAPSPALPVWVDQMVTRRVNDLLTQGQLKEQEKNYADAIDIYLEAVSLSPSDNRARERLLRVNSENYKEKWRTYEKQRAQFVSDAEDHRRANRATRQAQDGRLKEAERMSSKGRFAEAGDIILRVLEEDPSYLPAMKSMQDLQERMQNRLSAGGKFPNEDDKEATEGFLFYTQKKWKSAVESWRPIIDNAELTEKWGRRVNLGAYVAKANQNVLAQERQNKIDEAISAGLKNFRESRLEEAQTAFDEALKLDPSNTQAQAYSKMIPGLLESARQNVLSEVKQQQMNTALSDATEFFLKGYLDEAEAKVKLILDEMPRHEGALALAEEIREKRGLPKVPSVEELRTKEQMELEELYSQGIIAFAENRLDDAKKAWETVLSKDPNFEKAKRALKKANDEKQEVKP